MLEVEMTVVARVFNKLAIGPPYVEINGVIPMMIAGG
jgi:hypothetical protein